MVSTPSKQPLLRSEHQACRGCCYAEAPGCECSAPSAASDAPAPNGEDETGPHWFLNRRAWREQAHNVAAKTDGEARPFRWERVER